MTNGGYLPCLCLAPMLTRLFLEFLLFSPRLRRLKCCAPQTVHLQLHAEQKAFDVFACTLNHSHPWLSFHSAILLCCLPGNLFSAFRKWQLRSACIHTTYFCVYIRIYLISTVSHKASIGSQSWHWQRKQLGLSGRKLLPTHCKEEAGKKHLAAPEKCWGVTGRDSVTSCGGDVCEISLSSGSVKASVLILVHFMQIFRIAFCRWVYTRNAAKNTSRDRKRKEGWAVEGTFFWELLWPEVRPSTVFFYPPRCLSRRTCSCAVSVLPTNTRCSSSVLKPEQGLASSICHRTEEVSWGV